MTASSRASLASVLLHRRQRVLARFSSLLSTTSSMGSLLPNSSPIRAFILDITGVLYNSGNGSEGVAIAGSVAAVERLYKNSKVCFLSNESTSSPSEIVGKLRRLGFQLQEKDVITPAPIAAQYVNKNGLRPHIVASQSVSSFVSQTVHQENPNCVLLAHVEDLTYNQLNEAFRVLMSLEKPLLVSLSKGRFYQRVDGPCIDVGAFAEALKYASGCQHVSIGKPEPQYFQAALDHLGVTKDEAVMIGDDIVSDVGGAQKCGIRAVQVKTGKWRDAWANHEIRPFLIADNLAHAVQSLLQ